MAKAKTPKTPKAVKQTEGHQKSTTGHSVVPAKYRKLYAEKNDTCGDDVAEALRNATTNEDGNVDVSALARVGNDNGVDITKWGHLRNRDGSTNVGMIRMNLGNTLRGMNRRGSDVRIGKTTFKGKAQAAKPAKAPKAAKKAKAVKTEATTTAPVAA